MHVQTVLVCDDYTIYEKCFYFLLNSSFSGKIIFLRKLKLIYPSMPPHHYNNCSVTLIFNFLLKIVSPTPILKIWHRLYILYERFLPFYMANFSFTELQSDNIWRKLKMTSVWKMIYLISQIIFVFLTQIYYNMNFITLSPISSQDFFGTLRSIFGDSFWTTFFIAHTKCIFLNMSENLF